MFRKRFVLKTGVALVSQMALLRNQYVCCQPCTVSSKVGVAVLFGLVRVHRVEGSCELTTKTNRAEQCLPVNCWLRMIRTYRYLANDTVWAIPT